MPKAVSPIIQEIKDKPLDWAIRFITLIILSLATYITFRLAPLAQDIAVIKTEVLANAEKDEEEHPNFVTEDTFHVLIERINHISNRVDSIYGLLK